ncbi:MAG: hydroxylase for synthesis of 2-methylthio-cis-ribozeatin in tRNA [Bacteroidota bacterium]|nr:hydroxylase for synthesis of 2-methylthio-cis-ribozeatin in tRNA [Bacteroidota bacterium]
MLGLKLATDPGWVNLAQRSIADILTDHAYCEQKAASTCIGLIQLYPDREYLVDKLAPVVNEEWTHFRMVLEELKKRSLKLGGQRKDEYAMLLKQFFVKGGSEEGRFLDRILMAALIEARSCERFRLLSLQINDEGLKQFYHKLMIAEANHYRLFINIAEQYCDKNKVKRRWDEWVNYETKILNEMELRGDRMH